MHADYFGDSYDVVKRFFCQELRALGYDIVADPMFTSGADATIEDYCHFLGVGLKELKTTSDARRALFLDPDTGVRERRGPRHVTLSELAEHACRYDLVFVFDQAFSRSQERDETMARKIAGLAGLGCHSMYYSSHAHFLFLSRMPDQIRDLRAHLLLAGLPSRRLVNS